MEPECRDIPISVADGTELVATLMQPADLAVAAPVVVCFPAMGVRATYYRPLAAALCRQGLAAVTVDLRGIATSSVRAGRGCDFGYREIVELDYPAVLAAVARALPGRDVVVLGHSLGGQLACLFAATDDHRLAGIVLIASCSVYFRSWAWPGRLVFLLLQQAARAVAWVCGYFPGRTIGFAGREARRVVRDWAHQGRTGRFEVAGSEFDFEALLLKVSVPILALSFTDDFFAPRPAVEHLLAKMPAAPTTHLHLRPEELGGVGSVGHFGWVGHADLLAPRITRWLQGPPPGSP